MDIIKTAKELIKFKTETGNLEEAQKCLEYCQKLFAGTKAKVKIFKEKNLAPVILIANKDTQNFDVLAVGHLDVVPAEDKMFTAKICGNKMFGRGSLDMKSFAAVAFNSMEHVLKSNLNLNFGVLLSTDEEKGSKGLQKFLAENPRLKTKIVLDNDVAGDIYKIISKCKNPVFVKLVAKGLEAHGSTPWEGIDANEKIMQTLSNLRKIYPLYGKDGKKPQNKWIDTYHAAKICGGDVANVISNHCEALLDFRLVETSKLQDLEKNLKKCLEKGVGYQIVSSSTPVVMDEKDKNILAYKKLAEELLGKKVKFEHIGGATDAREFTERGAIAIMHSGSGEGMHTAGEFVDIDSVKKIAQIQIKFLEKLAKK